jgi:hypothetical protein
MELGGIVRRFPSSPLSKRRQIMANPDVTQGEEITAWQWLAGLVIIVVLLAAYFLGARNMQVASVDPLVAPPITHPLMAP